MEDNFPRLPVGEPNGANVQPPISQPNQQANRNPSPAPNASPVAAPLNGANLQFSDQEILRAVANEYRPVHVFELPNSLREAGFNPPQGRMMMISGDAVFGTPMQPQVPFHPGNVDSATNHPHIEFGPVEQHDPDPSLIALQQRMQDEMFGVLFGQIDRVFNENGSFEMAFNNLPSHQRMSVQMQVPAFPAPMDMQNMTAELLRVQHLHTFLTAALAQAEHAEMTMSSEDSRRMRALLVTRIDEVQRYMNDHANRPDTN
ncbi:unnamed protein product [Caenorhabditis sp. 36 PRJEB53466]|nr:unnamed protein product [Caenorhabditis sp. 36 PRJEB53466]